MFLLAALTSTSALTNTSTIGLLSSPITLAWDESPDPNVTGYALYYGWMTVGISDRLDVGPVRSVTLTNLYAGSNYFFYLVAYDMIGLESIPSNVLFYSPPAVTGLRVTKLASGAMSVKFRSAPDSTCRVEYTPTLPATQWQTLVTATADADGYVAVIDLPNFPPRSRFYRAARP